MKKITSLLLATGFAFSTSMAFAEDMSNKMDRAGDKIESKTERAGEAISDSAITTKVKSKLLAAKDLKSTGINVKTSNGTVWLSGTVEKSADKERVVDIVKQTKGVADVKEDLTTL